MKIYKKVLVICEWFLQRFDLWTLKCFTIIWVLPQKSYRNVPASPHQWHLPNVIHLRFLQNFADWCTGWIGEPSVRKLACYEFCCIAHREYMLLKQVCIVLKKIFHIKGATVNLFNHIDILFNSTMTIKVGKSIDNF